VLDADGPLQWPDFRAEERAFSLIVQLAGRAGRRVGEPATVVVQAWQTEARAVVLGARHAVEEFLEGEVARRRERGFPPFSHLVRVVVEGTELAPVKRAAAQLRELVGAGAPSVDVLGPAPLHRLRGRSPASTTRCGPRASGRAWTWILSPPDGGCRGRRSCPAGRRLPASAGRLPTVMML